MKSNYLFMLSSLFVFTFSASLVKGNSLKCLSQDWTVEESSTKGIYSFVGKMNCEHTSKNSIWMSAPASLKKALLKDKNFKFDHGIDWEEGLEKEKLVLSMEEFKEGTFGNLSIFSEYDMTLDNGFFLNAKSKKIEATGTAKLTQSDQRKIQIIPVDDGLKIKTKIMINVKKPWGTPFGVFKKSTILGLQEDLRSWTQKFTKYSLSK